MKLKILKSIIVNKYFGGDNEEKGLKQLLDSIE